MADKPLHVQVAEALGWTYVGESEGFWEGEPPPGTSLYDRIPRRLDQHIGIPAYDTDWAATGPLIEQYGIDLLNCSGEWAADWYGPTGSSECPDIRGEGGFSTPLIAVCHLILALKEAGKL